MSIRASYLALLISILPIAGCGTVANLARSDPNEGGMSSFGGVKHDVWCIRKAANGEFRCGANPNLEQYPQVVLMAFCAADLPLSLIGDLVTWPYAMAYTFINQPVQVQPVTLSEPDPTAPMTPVPVEVDSETPSQVLPAPAKLPLK